MSAPTSPTSPEVGTTLPELALYGDPTWHRERLCALHGLGAEEAK